jgi:hypothetical protein
MKISDSQDYSPVLTISWGLVLLNIFVTLAKSFRQYTLDVLLQSHGIELGN